MYRFKRVVCFGRGGGNPIKREMFTQNKGVGDGAGIMNGQRCGGGYKDGKTLNICK